VNGVHYINDSKSTTPEATVEALKSIETSCLLMVGGRSKGADYRPLGEAISKKIRKVILFGESAEMMAPMFRNAPTEQAATLREAFLIAEQSAKAGDTVLLSPANSSFDEFINYEARGYKFASWVAEKKKAFE